MDNDLRKRCERLLQVEYLEVFQYIGLRRPEFFVFSRLRELLQEMYRERYTTKAVRVQKFLAVVDAATNPA